MELAKELSAASLLKLLSFLFWGGLYTAVAVKTPERSPEWWSRIITLLHGSVAAVVGLAQCDVNNLTQCRLTTKILPSHYALMVWSWGYFAFDLLWCLLYWTSSIMMLFHHATALVAISLYMQKDFTGCSFACMLAMMEVTNPLLQTRWFLKNEHYDKTIIYLIIEVVYLTMFITLRGAYGTCLIYWILKTSSIDMEEKMISLALYIVSIAFIYDMLGYIMYKYKHEIKTFRDFFDVMLLALNEQE